MKTTVTTRRGNTFEIDETRTPISYLSELNAAKSLFMSGDIDYELLVVAAEMYIEAIKLYGKRHKKRVPVPSVAKLLR